MHRHPLTAGATLTFVALVQGCAGPRADAERHNGAGASTIVAADSALTCVNPGAAHKAYVVVRYVGGAVVQRCVGFDAPQLGGDDLMKLSGLPYETQEFSAGLAVCSIGGEPSEVAACFPPGVEWWFLYVSRHGGTWKPSNIGYAKLVLEDGDALGWRHGKAGSPLPLPERQSP